MGDLDECPAYDIEETDKLSGTVPPPGSWRSLGGISSVSQNPSQSAPAVGYHQSSMTPSCTRLHASRPVAPETGRSSSLPQYLRMARQGPYGLRRGGVALLAEVAVELQMDARDVKQHALLLRRQFLPPFVVCRAHRV